MAGFKDICCDICLDQVKFVIACSDNDELDLIIIACSDKSSKFNSFACTLVVSDGVLDFHVFGEQTFHWWMKAIYFTSFYFRVFNSIRENKNLAKQFLLIQYFVK